MRIVLVADTFPPLRTSGAVQLRDLSREFIRQGHNLTVLLPSANQENFCQVNNFEGIRVVRLKAPITKNISYIRRTIAEFMMPFYMLWGYKQSLIVGECWDGVVWYSPSIFHGPLVKFLKKTSKCKSYLIVRDIFPQWALDIGLMRRGLPYLFFYMVARYQYSVADVIGIQTLGNASYFSKWARVRNRSLEILNNWLDKPIFNKCSIQISETCLVGRKILVYAGNMGVAQDIDSILDLAAKFQKRKDVGFLFVGRGSEAPRLRAEAQLRQLNNVTFFDEIDPDEISNLYAQCVGGIVALNHRHKTHNIPGKFLTYMQNGLPVLAKINASNDLAWMIRNECVGQVCETNQIEELLVQTEKLIDQIETDLGLSARCTAFFEREFSVDKAVKQIVASLSINLPSQS